MICIKAIQKIENLQEQASQIAHQISLWEKVIEANNMEKDPCRDRMVIKDGDDYYASYRWEINPVNGWLTIQLGTKTSAQEIIPKPLGEWCPFLEAEDFFGIERNQIQIRDRYQSASTK